VWVQIGGPRLDQQGRLNKYSWGSTDLGSLNAGVNLGVNFGMGNALKLAARSKVVKNDCTQGLPVEVTRWEKHARSEGINNIGQGLTPGGHNFSGDVVSVHHTGTEGG
jgi:hypothetical protein